jgi:hypothetical protein
VIASDIGGLREAHLGVDYLIPITPITHYQPQLDMNMVPVADVPPQNVSPWEQTLRRLVTDRAHFEELSAQSRRALRLRPVRERRGLRHCARPPRPVPLPVRQVRCLMSLHLRRTP